MAVIPTMPREGASLVMKNMREARSNGMSRNMRCRKRTTGFIKKLEIAAHGTTNSKTEIWLTLAILTMVLRGLLLVYPKKRYLLPRDLLRPAPEHRNRNGEHGMVHSRMETIHTINSGLNRE